MRRTREFLAVALTAVVGLSVWATIDRNAGDAPALAPAAAAVAPTSLSAGPAAAAEARDAVGGPTGRVRVRVTDAASHAAIDDAAVRVARATAAAPSAVQVGRTDRDGVAWLADVAGDVIVAVQRSGFVAQCVECAVSDEGTIDVALARSCAIELTFRDAAGRPVSGVPVRLLPEPIAAPSWNEDWFRNSAPDAVHVRDAEYLASLVARDGNLDRRAHGERGGAPPAPSIDLTQPTRAASLALALPLELPGGRACDPLFRLVADRMDQTTDGDGVARWRDLPPGEYRWGLCAPVHATMTPAHENAAFTAVARGVRAGKDPVPLLSGVMVAGAGETLRYTVATVAGARLRGRVQYGVRGVAGQVSLVHRTLFGEGDAAVESHRVQATVALNDDGSFVFDNVGQGIMVVRASWWSSPSDLHYAAITVELAPGDDRDVGVLQPAAGAQVETSVRLVDRAGGTLDPVGLFGHAVEVYVGIDAVPDSRLVDASLSEMIKIAVGWPLRIHGVAPGRAWLRATRADDWTPVGGGSVAIRDAAVRELSVPATAPVELTMRVDRLCEAQFEVALPAGVAATRLEFWLRSRSTGEMSDARAPVKGEHARIGMSLPADEYDVFVRTSAGTSAGGACGFGAISVGADAAVPVRIELGAASGLRGRIVGGDQRPLPNTALEWRFEQRGRTWTVRGRTDRDGRFDVAGLPPGVRLQARRRGLDLQAPAVAEVQEVELVLVPEPRR